MDGSPDSRVPPRSSPAAGPRRPPRQGLLALAIAGLVIALVGVAFLMGTRSSDGAAGAGAASLSGAGPGQAGRHVYLLEPANRPRSRVSLEVAADEAARERGLSKRTELPPGTGMVFLFPTDTSVAFWMKDTPVPLQIAFVGGDGRVVGLFDMPPCRADPCPTYAPRRPYRYAVELPSGGFTAAGVNEGDRVVPQDPAALPAPS
ncbi:MAG TPA: DUF192 domain-containing protein [Actinomycetes bacterium]|nr:DUF192 domain-containing protein [Actinomycetes bacterium]